MVMLDEKSQKRTQFFISYNSADRLWAEWIAWQLRAAGYSLVIQAWDFRPGHNFVLEMQKATADVERTIAVMSPNYLNARYTQPEWAAAFAQDPTGEKRLLIPVVVRECNLEGLWPQIVHIRIVGLDESAARRALLDGIQPGPAIPTTPPLFPPNVSVPDEQPRYPTKEPTICNVPPRNAFFTGRDMYFEQLHDSLNAYREDKATSAIYAICGLAGMGKTYIAIEYAYRYDSEYKAILWVKADSRDILTTAFSALTGPDLLNNSVKASETLPTTNNQVNAVISWLREQGNWLLIFDNVEDLHIIREFLPNSYKGHVLLTTRIQNTAPIAQSMFLQEMDAEEGADFVLWRASGKSSNTDRNSILRLASPADRADARTISIKMGGLPLALDQAAAYIDETKYSFADYLDQYENERADLLKERGPIDHESVVTTWSLSFKKIEQDKPASAELLRCCAFLHPDAIPMEIIITGAAELGPILQAEVSNELKLNAVIRELSKYSLLQRLPKKMFSIHRLVQDVLKDGMKQDGQRIWAERIVRAINRVFPDEIDLETWRQYQRGIPQALACIEMIKHWRLKSPEAARLLDQTGYYLSHHLQEHSQYEQAETFYKDALSMRKELLGDNHTEVATSLYHIAALYHLQGEDDLAREFFAEAEKIWRKVRDDNKVTPDPQHVRVAHISCALAQLYFEQEDYTQAEAFFHEALTIYQPNGDCWHETARVYHNLAQLYDEQDNYEKAEEFYRKALRIFEGAMGSEHPKLILCLEKLATLYYTHSQYSQAEPLYTRELTIYKRALGEIHPKVIASLYDLAALYDAQGRYDLSEPLYQQALENRESALGSEHPDVASSLIRLAQLYSSQKRWTQAEPLYLRALNIQRLTTGQSQAELKGNLETYARILRELKREIDATRIDSEIVELQARR